MPGARLNLGQKRSEFAAQGWIDLVAQDALTSFFQRLQKTLGSGGAKRPDELVPPLLKLDLAVLCALFGFSIDSLNRIKHVQCCAFTDFFQLRFGEFFVGTTVSH